MYKQIEYTQHNHLHIVCAFLGVMRPRDGHTPGRISVAKKLYYKEMCYLNTVLIYVYVPKWPPTYMCIEFCQLISI